MSDITAALAAIERLGDKVEANRRRAIMFVAWDREICKETSRTPYDAGEVEYNDLYVTVDPYDQSDEEIMTRADFDEISAVVYEHDWLRGDDYETLDQLEGEENALAGVTEALKALEPSEDALPVLAFSPEAHDSWLDAVNRFHGYGVTITLASGEEVEAVYITQDWDEAAGDYRVSFYRVVDGDYPEPEKIPTDKVETAVGVRRIHVS